MEKKPKVPLKFSSLILSSSIYCSLNINTFLGGLRYEQSVGGLTVDTVKFAVELRNVVGPELVVAVGELGGVVV